MIGAAFYLMEPVDGFNATLGLPEPHALGRRASSTTMGLSMADAIGALARVDLAAAGCRDLGKPDGWGERQVPRWRKQLDSYGELARLPRPGDPAASTTSPRGSTPTGRPTSGWG